jgi:HIV Tat-specific factor 1
MSELDDFMEQTGGRPSASDTPPAADPSLTENSKKRKNAKEPEVSSFFQAQGPLADMKAQANKKPKVMENKAIWISNLPLDATKKELEDECSRYGIIDKGANGEPRIYMYETDGVFNGTAMVVYFKKEAIANAIRLMDDFPLRPGDNSNGNIHVEAAKIEHKKERDGEKIASKLTRKDRKASERNRAELNQ